MTIPVRGMEQEEASRGKVRRQARSCFVVLPGEGTLGTAGRTLLGELASILGGNPSSASDSSFVLAGTQD